MRILLPYFILSFWLVAFNPLASHAQEIFRYKFVQVLKAPSEKLDTLSKWENTKLKRTYELAGGIYLNKKKGYIKLKRFEDKTFEEINFIHSKKPDHYLFISGKRIYFFEDPLYGPTAAFWTNKNGTWIFYRKLSAEQLERIDQTKALSAN